MIYVYRKSNGIVINQYTRNLNTDDYIKDQSELLYTFPWYRYNLPSLYFILRPWKKLGCNEDLFKEGVCDVLENWKDLKTAPKEPVRDIQYIYKHDIEKEEKKFLDNYKALVNLERFNSFDKRDLDYSKIIYNCDIPNLLEDLYGETICKAVEKYSRLNSDNKHYLESFAKILTKEKKLEFVRSDFNNEVLEFLPPWCLINLRIFGIDGNTYNPKNVEIQEYKITDVLFDDKIQMDQVKNEVFQKFKLREVYSSWEIKSILSEIYEKYGIKKIPKVVDLYEFFGISCRKNSLYRIDIRKP